MLTEKIDYLTEIAKTVRADTIRMMGRCGGGHIGGSLSMIEAIVYLYFYEMNISKENITSSDRDRFVLSKGHAGPGLYAALCKKGFFPAAWLDTLNQPGTKLPSHCNMRLTPGVDFTTGSLGQGFSAAAGMALANKLKGNNNLVYALIGDGESQEGQIWETAMFAAHQGLNNFIAFTDNNKLQLDGITKDILAVEDLVEKWLGFGWNSERIDGHSFSEIDRVVQKAKNQLKPSMIILETKKAKGFSPGENTVKNHHMAFDQTKAETAIAELLGEK